jgi:nucleotide-binding universal stress UspA family protein
MTSTITAPTDSRQSSPTLLSGPIVVAVGGGAAADVLRAARRLTTQHGTDVLAVSALEPLPAYFGPEAPAFLPQEFDAARKESLLATLEEQLRKVAGPGIGWRAEVVAGETARALTDVACSTRSPLLVMGIGHHRPLDRLLGAETTLRVIRRASCPVLAINGELGPPFREAIVATDFSPASATAAEAAIPLLAEDAVLHLVHVWQPNAKLEPRFEALDESYRRSIPEKFRRLRATLEIPETVTINEHIREGRTADRLIDFATSHNADLIVAGRQGLGTLARIVVGSITSSLVRGARCSVLIAPEPGFADQDRFRRLLTGTSESRDPEEWRIQLDAFSRRNQGRATVVEVDDVSLGAQVLESGYLLQGTFFDPGDGRVEIMLAATDGGTRHVTRSIGQVESVAIATDANGRDSALRICHAPGQTVLTFSSIR